MAVVCSVTESVYRNASSLVYVDQLETAKNSRLNIGCIHKNDKKNSTSGIIYALPQLKHLHNKFEWL